MSTTGLSGASSQISQTAIKQQLDAFKQSIATDQKSGKLTGDALKKAQHQAADLTTAFNNLSQGGTISQSNLKFFGQQISSGNALLAQTAGAENLSAGSGKSSAEANTTAHAAAEGGGKAQASDQGGAALSPQVQAQLQALDRLTQINQNGGGAIPSASGRGGAASGTAANILA